MEEHPLLIVDWINSLLGPTAASIFGVPYQPGDHIIPMQVIISTIVLLLLFVFFGILRTRLSVENPGRVQQAMEVAVEFLDGQLEENIGHEGRKYLMMIGTIAFFIVFCNLLGLIPGLASPTSNINVPAGCAIVIFLYYNYQGIRKQGLIHYLKHFAGPVWWLAWLMVPIEIISHLARPFSLTVRLYANIFAEELLIIVFFGLIPLLLPLPFMAYAVFGGFLQAFIFITLSQVYIAGAVATEEH
jgi:F-type H+-transporting ATPase subunit a